MSKYWVGQNVRLDVCFCSSSLGSYLWPIILRGKRGKEARYHLNKTPGNDGLTIEFYLAFWDLVGECLVDALTFAQEQGQLSTSQKQAMITLLEKKDKDRRFIKNWRPISFINVDVKIASKAIARRLESILPELIHPNLNGFINTVRKIDDILEFAKVTEYCVILLAIDFEKAFDSLTHSFLFNPFPAE